MFHGVVRAIQAHVRHVLAAAKIKESKGLSRYHNMMPQKGSKGNKRYISCKTWAMTSLNKIKFDKSVFMMIEQPLFCIVPEMLDHQWLGSGAQPEIRDGGEAILGVWGLRLQRSKILYFLQK